MVSMLAKLGFMKISSTDLQTISNYRSAKQPEFSLMKAAVAIILRDGEHGTEFLLMQRAKHERDPWSGQMSFPGGKIESSDQSAKAAAIRETAEEVGINLIEQDYVGQLDDLYGMKVDNKYSVHVECFVFMPRRKLAPKGNYEVADLVWLPFAYLNDPAHAIDFYHPADGKAKMPAVMIDADKEQVLWGLSLRMLSTFYELLAWPLSVLSEQENHQLKDIENRNMSLDELDDVRRSALQAER